MTLVKYDGSRLRHGPSAWEGGWRVDREAKKAARGSSLLTMKVFFGALASLAIGLKLTNQIDCSWWWVLAPCWIPLAIFCFATVLALPAIKISWDD
jgi:hypothetical protein